MPQPTHEIFNGVASLPKLNGQKTYEKYAPMVDYSSSTPYEKKIDPIDEVVDCHELTGKVLYSLDEKNRSNFMLEQYVKEANVYGVIEVLKFDECYKLVDDITLYYYARNLIGKPISKDEEKLIKQEMKNHNNNLKKAVKKMNKKLQYKKGKYLVDF